MVVGAVRDMRARHGKRPVSADSAETAEPDTDNGDVISTAAPRHHVRERTKVWGTYGVRHSIFTTLGVCWRHLASL